MEYNIYKKDNPYASPKNGIEKVLFKENEIPSFKEKFRKGIVAGCKISYFIIGAFALTMLYYEYKEEITRFYEIIK